MRCCYYKLTLETWLALRGPITLARVVVVVGGEKSNNRENIYFTFCVLDHDMNGCMAGLSKHTILTEVVEAVAGSVEGTSVKLQPDDGEDDDSEEQQQGNVDQRTDGFSD